MSKKSEKKWIGGLDIFDLTTRKVLSLIIVTGDIVIEGFQEVCVKLDNEKLFGRNSKLSLTESKSDVGRGRHQFSFRFRVYCLEFVT